ncbi:signal peptidase I [Streptomyces sp. ACA25]|uniref:signal peptidase I n=1 Tax=Streptomyces sp. ACA25 TaxID=3022596 RepID=UPI002307BFD0|nr:signal peptidase I [Streptomyces sp. ACA25]MDB1089648.1 signal peptidase I [Streptomyces sp. ACA25]
MAVGARSGADGPEKRPVTSGEETPDERPPAGQGDDGAAAGGGAGTGDEPGTSGEQPQEGKKPRSFWKELPILIGIAFVLALLIKTFLLQAFSIPSDSMQNTLQRGDRVLVDKLTPWFGATPERGEVVVFEDPGGWLPPTPDTGGFGAAVQEGLSFIGLMPSADDNHLIKRVIAVGGDTIECQEGGAVMINGTALDESAYLFPGNTPCDDRPFGPLEIPEGRLWVMGDHRADSLDSRYHQSGPGAGTVSEEGVVGRAVVIAWPVNRWSFLSVPGEYDELSSAVVAVAPAALGLAGAFPLVLLRRHRATAGAHQEQVKG